MTGAADPERTLVLSRHVSFVALGPELVLCGHAFKGPREVVTPDERAVLEAYRTPAPAPAGPLEPRIRVWLRQGILIDAAIDEDAELAREFGPHVETVRHGMRRALMRSRHDPRVRPRIRPVPAVDAPRASWSVVYLGLCFALPSIDALVELGAERGLDIRAVGSFPQDYDLVAEQRPDFVVLGDLPRTGFGWRDPRPVDYADGLRAAIAEVRRRTAAPILLRNLVVPTCSLAGLAERGGASHVNKARALDVAIAELAAQHDAVYVVDVDQALALAGKAGLVDDAVVTSHHLASLTWLVDRAEREPLATAAHDLAALLRSAAAPRDQLEAERVIAAEDLRVMSAVLGLGRRKLVVVDLDDTLWPGVLAETGAPFPPELPVDTYPHHLYLGLHEALLALRDRGCMLACVSKNDEDVVRALWRYPAALDHAPRLLLDDFVTYRIDWNDKADNLAQIADELGVALDAVAFIDDSPRERELVRARFPEVLVLGDNPLAVRWQLLTDPAFEVVELTAEARRRSDMVRGQLARRRERGAHAAGGTTAAEFLRSLDLRCTIRRERDDANLARIVELVHRTTQLNTTGERPTADELRRAARYTLTAADRFADYGLVGACIADEPAAIRQLVLSCRVLELGLEDLLLCTAARDLATRSGAARIAGRLIATQRNLPARHLFARCGFARDGDGDGWAIATSDLVLPDLPYTVTLAL